MPPPPPPSASTRLSQLTYHLSGSQQSAIMSNPNQVDPFSITPLAPADPIFKLTANYKADKFEKKVNLGVGAYRDDQGKPWVLPVVKKAKAIIAADESIDHEYLPITGLPEFTKSSAELIFGKDSPAITENRVASVQTISGTGANHLAAIFLARYYEPWESQQHEERSIYISQPTWANHRPIFANLGLETKDYPYFDPKTIGLAYDGFVSALRSAPPHSIFLLHACAHNPTGVDPTSEQWNSIADVFLEKGHFAFFDCAYQGFASGDLDRDAEGVRLFVKKGIPLLVCQSYAKNAGLYGERIGCLNVVAKRTGDGEGGVDRIKSQLSVLQRSEISNPPTFGARVVALILNNPDLFSEWKRDIKTMADRIIDMREKLYDLLQNKYKTPTLGETKDWSHITKQIGMFSFTGLNAQQANDMVTKAHVYMTGNGRISMAGLNNGNVEYVAESIDKAVRGQL